MEINTLGIEGAWLASSTVHGDERGNFREWFKALDVERVTDRKFDVQQANISVSARGVLRGIHYSMAEVGQAKWVTCVAGSILDVVVDIRPSSPTYKKWISVELSALSGQAVLIGEGLGHAFVSLQDGTTVAYLVSSPFSPTEEFEINPLDSEIGIDWKLQSADLLLSDKDRIAPNLNERRIQGTLPSYISY